MAMISTIGLHSGSRPTRSPSPDTLPKVRTHGIGHHCPYEQIRRLLTNQNAQLFWNISHLSAFETGKKLKSLLQLFWIPSWKKIGHEKPTKTKEKMSTKDFVLSGTEK